MFYPSYIRRRTSFTHHTIRRKKQEKESIVVAAAGGTQKFYNSVKKIKSKIPKLPKTVNDLTVAEFQQQQC